MSELLLHVLALVHGLAATVACYMLFHVAGVALTPRRWESSLGAGASPAIIGAALYVLACWYGIQRYAPLTQVALGFVAFTLALSALRFRRVAARLRSVVGHRSTRGWLVLFAALYVLAYVFTVPPVTGEHLPLTWMGSKDILYYLNYAAYLLHLGPTTIRTVATDYFAYYQTPGAFHLLSGLSLLFGGSAVHAIMPAQFGLMSLAGLAAGWIARRILAASPLAATVVGGVVVASPFFRYIVGNYSLSTLFALPVLLHLLVVTLRHRPDDGWFSPALAGSLFAHYLLLFLVYPYLYVIGIGFQAAAVAFRALATVTARGPAAEGSGRGDAVRYAVGVAGAAALAAAAVALCTPLHSMWVVGMLRMLSQPGIAGWPKDLISPLALLGLPAGLNSVEAGGVLRPWGLAGLALLGLGAVLGLLAARRAAIAARAFVAVAGLGFLAYTSYFALVGVSYQQWKLASYVAMPFGFVFLAIPLAGLEKRLRAARAWALRVQPAHAVVAGAGLLLVGGNLAVHALVDPPFYRPPGSLRNLATLQQLPFRDLSVQANDVMTLFAAYYMPGKRFHSPSPEFANPEPISLAAISPLRPLLIVDYSCDGVGHGDTRTVEGVGCLLLQPPSLAANTGYPFERSFLFIEMSGLAPREGGGRWNTRKQVTLSLMADQRVLQLDRDAAWVNLLLEPALVPGMAGQRLRLSWGAGRRGEALLGVREWISLPLRIADWPATRVTSQVISVELPDILPPHWIDGPQGRYLESRPLAVRFVELSVSPTPRGRVVRVAE